MSHKQKFIGFIICGLVLVLSIAWGGTNSTKTFSKTSQSLYLPPHQDFRIAVISDLNSQYGSTVYEPTVTDAIALMAQWQPDLVLCGGDMIAGQKASLSQAQINSMWQAFDRTIAAPLRQEKIPFGFTIGNHDGSGAIKNDELVFAAERDLAQDYWLKHQQQLGLNFIAGGNFPFYYSFYNSDVFFLVWDASTHKISPEQLTWIKQTLNSDRAKQAKTRIAIGHLPLYPIVAAKNKPGEYLEGGDKLQQLLEQNQVRIYISGHHHAYYPGKKDNLELLHAGALGQGARQLMNSDLPPFPTVTIIDLAKETLELTYTTYNAENWSLISLKQLPTSITGEYGTILRRDL